jgi:hypothetical protein
MGVLPLQQRAGRETRVCITMRNAGRWIISKKWPMKKLKDYRAAERQAFEEAVLKGITGAFPLETYEYRTHGMGPLLCSAALPST